MPGCAAHRPPPRRDTRVRDRVRQRLARNADRAPCCPRQVTGRAGASHHPAGRRLPRGVPRRRCESAVALQVKIPGGGSVDPDGYRHLDVQDPAAMKDGLDDESLPNFVAAARGALERSGLRLEDVDFVCPLHTKRSMFLALLAELGMREDQAVYLDDTGHMSGVDSLLGLDPAVRDGRVRDGDVVLLLSAGTGYTWAATVVRWGKIP